MLLSRLFFSLVILVLVNTSVFAQNYFEGRMKLKQTNLQLNKNDVEEIDVFFTPNRIKIESLKKTVSVEMLGAEDVGQILVRLYYQDIVLYSNDMQKEALKISKMDIENMMNMMKNMAAQFGSSNQAQSEPQVSVTKTSEKQKISGYSATKTVVKSADKPNEEVHVWLTSDVNVNLGMLAENWTFLDTIVSGGNKWLKKGEFPLAVHTLKNGKMVSKMEVTEIEKGKVEPSKTDVPKGVQLLSFQDMLMKRMMKAE